MKILLLAVLLGLVLAVNCIRRKPHGGNRNGQGKPKNRCFILNCKKTKCSVVPTCDQCHRGFMRVKVPLGFACARGKAVKACTSNCEKCERGSCSLCDPGYALFKGRCTRRCPRGYKPVNRKCMKQAKSCTPNCKKCENGLCTACFRGHALYKARCVKRCPYGYKQELMNGMGDKKCVQSCRVTNCASCPRGRSLKCFKCKNNLYKLSATRLRDFCFSHCPSGYAPKTVNGVNICRKVLGQPYTTEPAPTPEQTPQPEFSTLEQITIPATEPEIFTDLFTTAATDEPETADPTHITTDGGTQTYTEPEDIWP